MLDQATLAALAQEEKRRLCPLDYWSTCCEPQEFSIRRYFAGDWVYIHAANRSGKTEGMAAATVAILQGRPWLIGEGGRQIKVPLVEPPVRWILGGASYKALSIGAVDTIRRLLGSTIGEAYKEEHAGNKDYVSLFRIKHSLSRNEDDWSKLYVFPYEGELPEGPGVDGWWANEPPPEWWLRAARNRKKAGRIMRRAIDATPRDRARWGPIRAMFPAEERKTAGGRVRIRWAVRDNRSLTAADIEQLVADNHDDPQAKAILEGEHVDMTGICPFATDVLEESLKSAKGGEMWGTIQVSDEDDLARFTLKRHPRGNIECWDPSRKGRFIVASDPSSGVYDHALPKDRQKRNPACINVVSLDREVQSFRFNGYVTPAELGIMSRALCDYLTTDEDEPLWIPETNGGWGDEMIRSFGEGYSNIYRPIRKTSSSGRVSSKIGWTQTAATRGLLFGSLQRAILEGWFKINSAESLKNLLSVKLDDKDRPDQGDGTGNHAEDAITLGMIAYVMENPQERRYHDQPKTAREQLERAAGIERSGVDRGDVTRDRWR